MKQNRGFQLAYLAGFIDADGAITLGRTKLKNGKYSYVPRILVNQVDGRVIDWLYGTFGGNVYVHKQYGRPDHYKPVHRWEVNSQFAIGLAKTLIPFLRQKRNQAEILVRFGALCDHQSAVRNGDYRWNPLTDDEWAERDVLFNQLKESKNEIRPSAAVTTKRSDPVNTGIYSLASVETNTGG